MVSPGQKMEGAKMNCPDCDNLLELKVLLGAMGYFLGYDCECGFWKDESSRIGTLKEANRYLTIAKRGK